MLHHIITALGLLFLTCIARNECFAQPWMPVPPFLLMHRDYYRRNSGQDLDQFYQPAMKTSDSQSTSKRYYADQKRTDLDIQIDTNAATTVLPHYARPYQQPAAQAFSQFVPNNGGGAVMTNSIPEVTNAENVWSADLMAAGSRPPMAHEYPSISSFHNNQESSQKWHPNEQSDHQMTLQMRRRISTGRERPPPGFQSVTNVDNFVPDQQSSMRDYVVNMGQRLNGGWTAYPTKKMYYSPINEEASEQSNRREENQQPPRFAMSNMFDPVGTPYDNGGFIPNNQIPWSPPPEPRPMPDPARRMDYDEQFYNMNRQPDFPMNRQPDFPMNRQPDFSMNRQPDFSMNRQPDFPPNEMVMPPFEPSGQFPFPPPVSRPRPRYSPRRDAFPVRHPGQPLRILEPAVPPSEFYRRFPLRDKSTSTPRSRPERRKRPQRIKGAAEEEQFEPGYGPVTKLRRWLYETSKLAGSSHGSDNSTSSASDTVNGISEPGYGPPPSNADARPQTPNGVATSGRDKRSNLGNLVI